MKTRELSIQELAVSSLFTVLIIVGALIKITIPIQPFPMHFTMQFFFVLLSGFVMGGRLGLLSVLTYLALGLSGIPVFAAGGGPSYLIRPTFGFLLGFAGAAYVTGKVFRRLGNHHLRTYLLAAFCGMMVMYGSGMIYFYVVSNYLLGMAVPWSVVIVNCFLLTVGGDSLLCVIAAVTARRLIPLIPRLGE